MSYRVKACICHEMSFAEMKILSEERNFDTVEDVMQATDCGTGCGLCRPYIEKMLATGETEMELIPDI